jgi:hypothetical protein
MAAALLAYGLTFPRFADSPMGGPLVYVQIAGAIAAAVVSVWVVVDADPDRYLPVALALLLTLIPWAAGLVAAHLARAEVRPYELAEDDMREHVIAVLGQSLAYDRLGAWISAALAASLGLALFVTAPRVKTRWWIAPLAAAPPLLATFLTAGALDPFVASASLALPLAIGIAAIMPSHHALAGALCLAVAIALAATASATGDLPAANEPFFREIGDARIRELADTAARWTARDAANLALFFGGCGGLAIAMIGSVARIDRRPASIARGIAAFVVFVSIATSFPIADRGRSQLVAAAVSTPWSGESGFQPTTHGYPWESRHAALVVTRDRLVPRTGTSVPLGALHSDPTRVRAVLRRFYREGLTRRARYERALAQLQRWNGDPETRPSAIEYYEYERAIRRIRADHEIAIAVDRRLPVATFRALLRALGDEGYDRVRLVGHPLPDGTASQHRAIAEQPYIAAMIAPACTGQADIILERAVLSEPLREQRIFDAVVRHDETRLIPRPGTGADDHDALVFLTISDDATMDDVTAVLREITWSDAHAVFVASPGRAATSDRGGPLNGRGGSGG